MDGFDNENCDVKTATGKGNFFLKADGVFYNIASF